MKNQFKHIEIALKGIVPKRSSLPILENVALQNNTLRVTDLELSAKIPFQSGVNIAIPAKDFLLSLKNQKPVYSESERKVTINGSSKVTGESLDEFPSFPVAEREYGVFSKELIEIMHRASFFVSTDELRPAQMGVYVDSKNITATDGHRLFSTPHGAEFKSAVIIPAKAVKLLYKLGFDYQAFCAGEPQDVFESVWSEREFKIKLNRSLALERAWIEEESGTKREKRLKKLMRKAEEIKNEQRKTGQRLTVSYLRFVAGNGTEIITRCIEEKYPNYKCVIPAREDVACVSSFDKKEFLSLIKEAQEYANQTTKQIRLSINGALKVSAEDADYGKEFSKEMLCGHSGKDMEIGLNATYLLSLGDVLKEDTLNLAAVSPNTAVFFGDDIIIMPMRLTN